MLQARHSPENISLPSLVARVWKGFGKNSGLSATGFAQGLQDSHCVSIEDQEVLDGPGQRKIYSAHNEKSLAHRVHYARAFAVALLHRPPHPFCDEFRQGLDLHVYAGAIQRRQIGITVLDRPWIWQRKRSFSRSPSVLRVQQRLVHCADYATFQESDMFNYILRVI